MVTCKKTRRNQSFLIWASNKLNIEMKKSNFLKVNPEDKYLYDIFVSVKEEDLGNKFSATTIGQTLFNANIL